MTGIIRLVLDVLIPFEVSPVELSKNLSSIAGVEGVDILIVEVERRVETAKITIEGNDIDFEKIKGLLDMRGTSIQSIDRISSGKRIVGGA